MDLVIQARGPHGPTSVVRDVVEIDHNAEELVLVTVDGDEHQFFDGRILRGASDEVETEVP